MDHGATPRIQMLFLITVKFRNVNANIKSFYWNVCGANSNTFFLKNYLLII